MVSQLQTPKKSQISFWCCLGLMLASFSAALPAQTVSTWLGGAGNWEPCPDQGGNALWDTCSDVPPVYPNGNFDAVVDGGPVTLGKGNGIEIVNLTVAKGQNVIVTPGYLFISGTSIQNNGTISVGGGDGFNLDGTQSATLSGRGNVTMTDPGARFWGMDGPSTLTNKQTVQGQGSFSLGMNLINEGKVNANVNGGTLSMQPTTAKNTGVMEASSGSTLAFTNGAPAPYNNTGGVIKALNGGTVQLDNGVYTGGTIMAVGTGVVQVQGAAVLNALSTKGTLQIQVATLQGTINNTGTIQVPAAATLTMSGNVTLSGKGSVLLSGNGNLKQLGGTDTLTNKQLIRGGGTIFELPLTNLGTVQGDDTSTPLTLAGGTTTNHSILQASGGGTLTIQNDNKVSNKGGKIQALTGSTVLFGGIVSGGALTTSGTGTIQSQNGTLDGTTTVPTNSGALDVNDVALFLQGTINNTGTITLTGNSCVVLNQPTILTGSGTLNMGSSSCIYGSGLAFTNKSTIEGAGTIGDSNPMPITNEESIVANQASPLLINPDSHGFTNTGKLVVNNGSTLTINGPFNNLSKNGMLTAGKYMVTGILGFPNSVVTNAGSITLTGSAAEIMDDSAQKNALAALAVNAAKGSLSLQAGQSLTVANKLTNKGAIVIDATSSLTAAHQFAQSGGTITVDGGLTAPAVSLLGGKVFGKGTIGGAIHSSATITPGDSATSTGVLSVNGTYTQAAAGALNIAIAGTQVGTQYDQLAVTNGVSLNGTLNIRRLHGFVPAIGDTFTIVSASTVSGTFATVNGTRINSSEHFEVEYGTTAVTLKVVSGS